MIARKKKLKYQKDQTLQVTLKPHDNRKSNSCIQSINNVSSDRMSEDTEETKATENSEIDEDKHNSMV